MGFGDEGPLKGLSGSLKGSLEGLGFRGSGVEGLGDQGFQGFVGLRVSFLNSFLRLPLGLRV